LRYGQQDRRITILKASNTQGSRGSVETSFAIFIPWAWAKVVPVKGSETFTDPAEQATQQVEFRVRWSGKVQGVTPKDRIVYPGIGDNDPSEEIPDVNIYRILSINEIGRREGLSIICERRADT
jgi:head-tail adaptor